MAGFIVVSTQLILTNEGYAHLLFGTLQPRIFIGFQSFETTSAVTELRNAEEHDYRSPGKDRAKDAIEIASLFVRATKDANNAGAVIFQGKGLGEMVPHTDPQGVWEITVEALPEDPFRE